MADSDSFLFLLPDELLLEICKFLPLESLACLSAVSARMLQVARDMQLHRNDLLTEYGIDFIKLVIENSPGLVDRSLKEGQWDWYRIRQQLRWFDPPLSVVQKKSELSDRTLRNSQHCLFDVNGYALPTRDSVVVKPGAEVAEFAKLQGDVLRTLGLSFEETYGKDINVEKVIDELREFKYLRCLHLAISSGLKNDALKQLVLFINASSIDEISIDLCYFDLKERKEALRLIVAGKQLQLSGFVNYFWYKQELVDEFAPCFEFSAAVSAVMSSNHDVSQFIGYDSGRVAIVQAELRNDTKIIVSQPNSMQFYIYHKSIKANLCLLGPHNDAEKLTITISGDSGKLSANATDVLLNSIGTQENSVGLLRTLHTKGINFDYVKAFAWLMVVLKANAALKSLTLRGYSLGAKRVSELLKHVIDDSCEIDRMDLMINDANVEALVGFLQAKPRRLRRLALYLEVEGIRAGTLASRIVVARIFEALVTNKFVYSINESLIVGDVLQELFEHLMRFNTTLITFSNNAVLQKNEKLQLYFARNIYALHNWMHGGDSYAIYQSIANHDADMSEGFAKTVIGKLTAMARQKLFQQQIDWRPGFIYRYFDIRFRGLFVYRGPDYGRKLQELYQSCGWYFTQDAAINSQSVLVGAFLEHLLSLLKANQLNKANNFVTRVGEQITNRMKVRQVVLDSTVFRKIQNQLLGLVHITTANFVHAICLYTQLLRFSINEQEHRSLAESLVDNLVSQYHFAILQAKLPNKFAGFCSLIPVAVKERSERYLINLAYLYSELNIDEDSVNALIRVIKPLLRVTTSASLWEAVGDLYARAKKDAYARNSYEKAQELGGKAYGLMIKMGRVTGESSRKRSHVDFFGSHKRPRLDDASSPSQLSPNTGGSRFDS